MRILVVAATCVAASSLSAQTTWTSFADRRGHAMAATPTGGVVMFGGESVTTPGELLGDTNQLSTNNQTWTEAGTGGSAPPPTTSGAMAATTIAGANRYIFFGGVSPTGVVGGTWSWNGTAWGDVTPVTSPQARSGHAMVTNTATNTMFLFGGFDGIVAKNDIWEFAPQTNSWAAPAVTGGPPAPRFGHCMAFHPGNGGTDGRVYVFGGSPFRNDLWEFNPFTSSWTQLSPALPPPGRRLAAMAYLAGSDTIVMFGGLSSGGVIRNDTWSYDRWTNTWTQENPGNVPPARYEHAVSADNTGNSLVLLGGTNVLPGAGAGPVIEGTWLWSSLVSNWILQLPSPSPRDGAAMAYDSARNRHVVFGGRTVPGGADLDQTWEIDGLNWRSTNPNPRPSTRSDAGMAFDSYRSTTLLFGGWQGGPCGTALGDTWEWNGTNWAQRFPVLSPPATGGVQPIFDSIRNVSWMPCGPSAAAARMHLWSWNGSAWIADPMLTWGGLGAAYDELRQELVVFQDTHASSFLGSTVLMTGTGWRRPAPSVGPSLRFEQRMVWDAARQEVVLFGGTNGTTQLGDTWAWNGVAWALKSTSGPTPRQGVCLAYDSIRQRVVLFGGVTAVAPSNETWEWNGTAWSQVTPATSPSPRWNAACAFDPIRGRTVVMGGSVPAGSGSEIWEYDGSTWQNRTPASSFSPRNEPRACFDPQSSRVLMFGGYPPPNSETWLWDGQSLVLASTTGPNPRWGGQAVRVNNQVLFLGGVNGAVEFRDVWAWNGTAWSEIVFDAPSYRTDYGAAFDSRRDRLVVFGGRSDACGGAANDETWEWDGDSWLRRTPPVAPSPRFGCKMAFDETRRRIVLYGGTNGAATYSDTWEWDGGTWLLRTPSASPPPSAGHTLAFDESRRVTIAFGSLGTWDYGPVNPASLTLYGSGCPTSASVPVSAPFALKPLPWTGAWLGEPVEMEFTNAPPGLGMFVWGFDYQNSLLGPLPVSLALLGLGPAACMLRNSFEILDIVTPIGGPKYTSFPMPTSPAALGLRLYGQAAFFDLGLPGVPIVTSNGAEMVFGQK